jgi:hypothetical protein
VQKLLLSFGASLALTAGLLNGCGGSDSPPATPAATTTTLSGSAVKGPVNGATVRALTLAGAVLGTTTTSATGTYSLSIDYSGAVVLEVNGGTYIDEATGVSTALNQLKAIVNAGGGAQTVNLTPLTYLAYGYSNNTLTGFNTALTNAASQFGLGSTNLLTTLPVVTGTTNDYGRVLRAMSKHVQNLGSGLTFEQYMGQMFTAANLASMQTNFSVAFNAINGAGSPLTFAFNGAGITIAGTGVGGGSGTCGVGVNGNVQGIPVNFNYCVTGLVGQCVGDNISLNTALAGAAAAGVNLTYTYSNSCSPGATPIVIQ